MSTIVYIEEVDGDGADDDRQAGHQYKTDDDFYHVDAPVEDRIEVGVGEWLEVCFERV